MKNIDTNGIKDDKHYLKLWVNLLKTSSVIEKQLDKRLQERFNCSLARFDILSILSRHTLDGILMKNIGNMLKVSGGNVTAHIKKLKSTGYIQCMQKPDNRKNIYVFLTKSGLDFFQQVAKFHETLINQYFHGLSIENAIILTEKLKLIPLQGLSQIDERFMDSKEES